MKRRFGLLVTMLTLTALVIGVVGVSSVGATKKGTEGCTPGYWKNHTEAWVGYTSDQAFSSVFDDAFPGQDHSSRSCRSRPAPVARTP